MDMLRFHKFTAGRFWVDDYGSSDNPEEFKALLAEQGFEQISIEPTRIYHIDDARVMGAFVRAQKPLE